MEIRFPLKEMISNLETIPGITATEQRIDLVELKDGRLAQLTAKLETDRDMWIMSDTRSEFEVK